METQYLTLAEIIHSNGLLKIKLLTGKLGNSVPAAARGYVSLWNSAPWCTELYNHLFKLIERNY